MTHNLPRNDAQKIKEYENLALELRNNWKLKNVHGEWKDWSPNIPTIPTEYRFNQTNLKSGEKQNYRAILSVLDPRKCEYLKDYSFDFEHAYMTTYLAS